MPKMFVSFLPAAVVAINVAAKKALRATADIGRNEVMEGLRNVPPRTGARYKKPYSNIYYTASAPGEFPALRFGDLRDNVGIKPKGDDFLIGTDKVHGLILEKKPPSKGGREWLRPLLKRAKPKMLLELGKRWF